MPMFVNLNQKRLDKPKNCFTHFKPTLFYSIKNYVRKNEFEQILTSVEHSMHITDHKHVHATPAYRFLNRSVAQCS